MKTYIVQTKTGMAAVEAKNKNAAYIKVKAVHPTAQKTSVMPSSVNIAYCECEKLA